MDEHASRPVDRGDEPAPDLSHHAQTAGASEVATGEERPIAATGHGELELFPTERPEHPLPATEPLSSPQSLFVSVADDGSAPVAEEHAPPAAEPRAFQDGLDRVRDRVIDRLAGALAHVGRAAAVARGRPQVSPDKLIVASGSALFVALLLLTYQPSSQDDAATVPLEPPAHVDWESPPPGRGAPDVAHTPGTIAHGTQETEPSPTVPSELREREIARVSTPPASAESDRAQPASHQPAQPPPARPQPRQPQPPATFAATRAVPGSSEPASVARTGSIDDSPPSQAAPPASARELPPAAHVLSVDTPDAAVVPPVETPATAPRAFESSPPQPAVESDLRARSAAVQRVLNRYRDAFNALDPAATRAVWPSVDMSALGRAFDQIREQHLAYDNCRITVIGDGAEASCAGTLRYVPRMGANQTRVEARVWRFTLREGANGWAIESVVIG